MGLFGKKKTTAAQEPEAAPQEKQSGTKAGSGKKRTSGLSQVLHESVVATALDKFKANDAFIHYEGGEAKYIGIVLNVTDIGGLDKKSRKDEAKGSIIECINSGSIQTYITAEMMDAGYICIIPDAATLIAMNDFSLLTDAPYEFCKVDQSGGEPEFLGIKTTFAQIADLSADDGHIDDILGDSDSGSASDEEDDDDFFDTDAESVGTSGETAVPEVSEEPDDDVEAMDDIPDVDAPQPLTEPDMADDMSDMTGADSFMDETGEGEFDPYADAMRADDMPEQTIPEDFSDKVVVRKFYSEDLGLEVTSEPFDAQFMQNNPYVPFEEHREPGWINEQLNEMSRSANVELSRMHRENQWQLRERFFKLMSLACERIRSDLDIHDGSTQYGQMYEQIQRNRQSALEGIDRRVMQRKEEIERNWRQRLQEVGMDAARRAQHDYRERYGRQHDLEIYNIEAAERASIEDDYHDALHELFERRRIEAASLQDLSMTEVLDELSDMYLTSLADERARYQELDEGMRRFVDAHRQEDVARAATMAEDLRQTEKADKVLAEQTAKMQSLSEEYRQKRESLLEEIENIKRENAQALASLKEAHEQDEARWKKEKEELIQRYDELLARYQDLDKTKEAEFAGRVQQMRDTNDMLEDRLSNVMEVHRRSNLLSVFLLVACVIAALTIGFIGGEYINTQRRTALEQQKILEEYQQDADTSDPAVDSE